MTIGEPIGRHSRLAAFPLIFIIGANLIFGVLLVRRAQLSACRPWA
jgi:hypothetical protein